MHCGYLDTFLFVCIHMFFNIRFGHMFAISYLRTIAPCPIKVGLLRVSRRLRFVMRCARYLLLAQFQVASAQCQLLDLPQEQASYCWTPDPFS